MKYKRPKNKKKKNKNRFLNKSLSKQQGDKGKSFSSPSSTSSKSTFAGEKNGRERPPPRSNRSYRNQGGGRIDFLGKAKYFASLSFFLTFVSLICIFLKSFNYGIDFAGGTEIQIQFSQAFNIKDLREFIQNVENEDLKNKNYTLQSFGQKNEFLLRIESLEEKMQDVEKKQGIEKKPVNTEERDQKMGRVQEEKEQSEKSKKSEKGKISEKAGQDKKSDQEEKKSQEEKIESVNVRTQAMIQDIIGSMKENFKDSNPVVRRVDSVGPQIGSELKRNGFLALFYSLLIILIYVGLRFDYKYAPGAVFCLFHDAIITLGIFSFFEFEINVQTMAAVLTIIGYSLNDTIVNFDRVRENVQIFRDLNFKTIVNRSINEVLSRTLLTSITTLIALGAMYFISGGVIRDFAFTLGIGVIIGTYSSIYVASPLVILLNRWEQRMYS